MFRKIASLNFVHDLSELETKSLIDLLTKNNYEIVYDDNYTRKTYCLIKDEEAIKKYDYT